MPIVERYFTWTLRLLQATAYLLVILPFVDGTPKTFHTSCPKLAEPVISVRELVSLYYSILLSSCHLEWQNFIVHSQAGHVMFPQAGREQKEKARETPTKDTKTKTHTHRGSNADFSIQILIRLFIFYLAITFDYRNSFQ